MQQLTFLQGWSKSADLAKKRLFDLWRNRFIVVFWRTTLYLPPFKPLFLDIEELFHGNSRTREGLFSILETLSENQCSQSATSRFLARETRSFWKFWKAARFRSLHWTKFLPRWAQPKCSQSTTCQSRIRTRFFLTKAQELGSIIVVLLYLNVRDLWGLLVCREYVVLKRILRGQNQ